ncbi:MAG TPA: trypsin-like peptidase domain-containing protein [Candidatus Nanoarchaeia archaeon]|nr:trypsin-like peptidase domain-containing protein [Candidatus Nanoarchaeia archaeon]
MRDHKNILYLLVLFLLIIQITSLVVMSVQITKVNDNLEKKENNITLYVNSQLTEQARQTTGSLSEISQNIISQRNDLSKEIQNLKAGQSDFSEVIEKTIRGVVSVGTDKSVGTGFIVNEDGYIITNNHVIAQAQIIQVMTFDKNILPATLIGSDIMRDIAVLKIEGKYPALQLEQNTALGNKVIAIGNPLGLSFTVTEGIISAMDRVGPNGLAEYLQTDVSLNHGNSGGPLIDTQGKVVGVNNFKLGEAENIGFALRAEAIKTSANAIANKTIIQ